MTETSLVSIIVPVYNVKDYLPSCLGSICGQSYRNIEIILIDDGSTDGSGDICDQYANMDARIRVIHQNNQGAAIAKNAGLDVALGDFIWLIDADDYVSKDALSILLSIEDESGADVTVFGFFNVYTDNVTPASSFPANEDLSAKEYLSRFPNDWSCSVFWNKFFRRECIGNVRFKNERRCIDDEFFTYRIFFNAKTVHISDKKLYFYRQRKGSVTKSSLYDRQRSHDALDGMEQRYCDIHRIYPDIERAFLVHQFQMIVYMTSNYYVDNEIIHKIKMQLQHKIIPAIRYKLDKGEILAAIRILLTANRNLIARNTYSSSKKTTNTDNYFD